MIKILGKSTSINVRKVLWACDEIGVPFEQVDWGGDHKDTHDPAFLKLNPNALVPVVLDGEFVLWESNVIVRYLAAQYGSGDLLPEEPKARAQVEQWMDWQAGEFNNSWRYAFQALVRENPAFDEKAKVEESVSSWNAHAGILADQLAKTGGYVAGEQFTVADIPMGLAVNRWFSTPMERPDLPEVTAYYERLSKRPAFMAHGRNGVP